MHCNALLVLFGPPQELRAHSGETLLAKFKGIWELFAFSCKVTNHVADYLNRYFVRSKNLDQSSLDPAVVDVHVVRPCAFLCAHIHIAASFSLSLSFLLYFLSPVPLFFSCLYLKI